VRGLRTIRTRLLIWFVFAIVLAFTSSALVVGCSRPEAFTTGTEVMAKNVATRVASQWDNPKAAEAYVAQFREVTGLDATLERDPGKLPRHLQRAVRRGHAFAPHGADSIYVPIVKHDRIVGAVQMDRYGGGLRPRPLWPIALALAAALAVLFLAASYVSNRLARPLESLANTAQRFGEGDLRARAESSANQPKRWMPDEVRNVAVSFDKMAERVEATVRGQRELLAAISHELRSPLGRARVALEIARDKAPGAHMDAIERQLGEVDAILGDLLAVTRAGLADLRREKVVLAAWLRERIAAEPTPPDIELETDLEATEVEIDAPLLGRAIHNLFANARAHGHPEDQPLRVRAMRKEARIEIVVRDDGPGFPPEFLPRAFEPFERGDSARVRVGGGGTGLGLALVRRIAEAHGGAAIARNVPGGAEVAIELPAV
jgi:two-component system OmpR family sensor kinase